MTYIQQDVPSGFDADSYGEIQNGEGTYREIASRLVSHGSVIIGWTDNLGTHFDVMFSFPLHIGYIQRGQKPGDLFVSITGRGTYGFDPYSGDLHEDYICEKLLNNNPSSTAGRLADLINGVRGVLTQFQKTGIGRAAQ
jgi:hypothetical protein